ncbi:MAG: hypothetical protein WB609_06785 [Candidatus Cybelea sp.]
MRRTDVRIDHVVLRGFDPGDRQALASGLSDELSRALADPQMQLAARQTPVLRLGKMPMQSGQAGARNLGTSIARSIAKGIKR